jgi:hypothetical protein
VGDVEGSVHGTSFRGLGVVCIPLEGGLLFENKVLGVSEPKKDEESNSVVY